MEKLGAEFPLVPMSMLVPLLGSLFVLLLPERFSKSVSVISTGINFLIAIFSLAMFDFSKADTVQFYEYHSLLSELKVGLAFGLDGLSMLMYILTTLVSFVAILWSVRDSR